MPIPPTTSSPSNDAAIISAVAGISGVLLGGLITTLKDVLLNRSKNKADKTYLAILVGAHLNRYIEGCFHVSLDDGQSHDPYERNAEENLQRRVEAPEFKPLDLKVEWKLLPPQLMADILGIPGEADRVESSLAGIAMQTDEPVEYFWARREQWGYLGLKVVDVARRLRKHSGLPKPPKPEVDWSVAGALQEAVDKVAAERKAHETRQAEIHARLLARANGDLV